MLRHGVEERHDRARRRLAELLLLHDAVGLALRVGGEKSEEEADTVGCCSLRAEHVFLEDDHRLHLKFLGKDSIEYDNNNLILLSVEWV